MRAALVIGWMLVASVASAQHTGAASCDAVQAGSEEAELCAAEAFRAAESTAGRLDLEITAPLTSTELREAVIELRARMTRAFDETRSAALRYHAVLSWRRPRWTMLALAAEARVYEQLYDSFRSADNFRTDDHLRGVVRQALPALECPILVRYVLVVRAARANGIRDLAVTDALERLRRHEVGRIFQCVAEQQTRDASLGTFSAGELAPLPP